MDLSQFRASLGDHNPPENISAALCALWWDAKGDWNRAHSLIDDLETSDAMAVHAYLHRKEGSPQNAEYWYARSARSFYRPAMEDEWVALAEELMSATPKH